jgi:hypothetical protein
MAAKGTNPQVVRYKSVEAAAKSGDSRAALLALRDRLARDIDSCKSRRDLAALSLRFLAVLERIDAGRPSPRTLADELRERRAERLTEPLK